MIAKFTELVNKYRIKNIILIYYFYFLKVKHD